MASRIPLNLSWLTKMDYLFGFRLKVPLRFNISIAHWRFASSYNRSLGLLLSEACSNSPEYRRAIEMEQGFAYLIDGITTLNVFPTPVGAADYDVWQVA